MINTIGSIKMGHRTRDGVWLTLSQMVQHVRTKHDWYVIRNPFMCRCFEFRLPVTGSSEYYRAIVWLGKNGGIKSAEIHYPSNVKRGIAKTTTGRGLLRFLRDPMNTSMWYE